LNTTLSNPAVPDAVAVPAPKKRGWLPLLTALFLLSYALMTMLIVEQGRTIDSQRFLIRQLFQDSTELSASKIKALQQRNQAAQAQDPPTQSPTAQAPITQTPSSQTLSNQAPLVQTPSNHAPSKQAPSSQAAPQHRTQNEQQNQKQFKMPSRPASELAEEGRALVRI
jgi:cytoskeletal protein RodZ